MRNITVKQLRLLTAAARGGSFAAAADACHVTPPAVTMQMRQLEAEVGLPLFERDGRGLSLTAAGKEVLAAAERIDAVLADCAAGLADLKSLADGRVAVGVVSTAKYFAPQMLAAFSRSHPGIDIELLIGNREDTITAFKDGRFDVAIMGRPPEGVEVESAPIGDHPQVIIAPPDHPLARRRAIPPQEIGGETLLMRESGSGTRLLAERFLKQHGIKPRIGMEIGSNETIKQAVIAGLGIAFISGHTIASEIHDGRLVVLDVKGLPEIVGSINAAVPHKALNRSLTPCPSPRPIANFPSRSRFLPPPWPAARRARSSPAVSASSPASR
ncbi:MAG: LysR family transcriptional regulator [Pseudolabrys sp.]